MILAMVSTSISYVGTFAKRSEALGHRRVREDRGAQTAGRCRLQMLVGRYAAQREHPPGVG